MSTMPPYEGPTERIGAPRPAVAPEPLVHERVVAPPVDPFLLGVERALDSLRTWVAILGLVAVAALAVAIYAAVQANGSNSGYASNARVDRLSSDVKALRAGRPVTANAGAGASAAATSALAARVSALESAAKTQPASAAGGNVAAVAARVSALESTVKTLANRPTTDSTQAIQQLSNRVDTLTTDVAQLKQTQASQSSP